MAQATKPPPERLRFLLAWGLYPKGAIVTVAGWEAANLKQLTWYGRRVVEVLPEPPPVAAETLPDTELEPETAGSARAERKRRKGTP